MYWNQVLFQDHLVLDNSLFPASPLFDYTEKESHYMPANDDQPITRAEFERISDPKMFSFHNPAVKTKVNPNSEAFAVGYYQDIFWALLNSNEFILNH